jgi:polyhydroxyalkanoate synthesis regulator phasin
MMQLLAELVERGEITVPAARSVRDLYRQQKENSNDGGTVV